MKQAPSSIFMVRPTHFGFNHETAGSNAFQKELICDQHKVQQTANAEFDNFVNQLRVNKIEVFVFDPPTGEITPDAVFPNNWISFHEDGKVILYPMLTKNRRIERNIEVVDELSKRFVINQIIDISSEENNGRILEGTGSIIFDPKNKVAYANESARTNKNLFYDICHELGYDEVFFKATDKNGVDIYHTNVMMMIGDGYAVICKEAIDKADAPKVINSLQCGGLQIIDISYKQLSQFAGNMIQVQNTTGENFLVMSDTAFQSLNSDQKKVLSKYVRFIHADLKTIETVGGGSARCMIAGIHLMKK